MIEKIRTKLRGLIGDLEKSTSQAFTYSSSKLFTLTEPNANSITKVTVNGEELGSGQSYTFDSSTNIVTFVGDLEENDIVQVYFKYYDYSDTELDGNISSALVWLSVLHYRDFELEDEKITPTPQNRETDLIALVASILMKPNYSRYSLPNLTVTCPETMDKDTKIKKIVTVYKRNYGIAETIDIYEEE